MYRRLTFALRAAVHLGAWLPLILLIWDFSHHGLGANPIRAVQLRTGLAAINLLMASLACTPIYLFTRFEPLLTWRGLLGRYALMYATLHFFNFLGVDYNFNFSLIRQDLFKKRYAVVGFAAFLLLLPIGIASVGKLKTRLGRTFLRLKWMVYPAAILGVVHYLWQARLDTRLPYIYGGVLLFFLLVRLPPVRRFVLLRTKRWAHASG